jgi:MFS family permease
MLVVVHLLLGYTQVEPISLLVGLGVAYAMYAATFWSSVSLLVKKHHTGLAYGIVISMFNVGMSCFPMMVAWVYTTSNDHYIPYVELCFVELAALALIIGVYINYYDNRHDNTLNMRATLTIPERERRSTHSSNHYSDFSYDGLLQGTSTLTGANRVSTEAIKYSFVR